MDSKLKDSYLLNYRFALLKISAATFLHGLQHVRSRDPPRFKFKLFAQKCKFFSRSVDTKQTTKLGWPNSCMIEFCYLLPMSIDNRGGIKPNPPLC